MASPPSYGLLFKRTSDPPATAGGTDLADSCRTPSTFRVIIRLVIFGASVYIFLVNFIFVQRRSAPCHLPEWIKEASRIGR